MLLGFSCPPVSDVLSQIQHRAVIVPSGAIVLLASIKKRSLRRAAQSSAPVEFAIILLVRLIVLRQRHYCARINIRAAWGGGSLDPGRSRLSSASLDGYALASFRYADGFVTLRG